jgi:hypothetical protein
MNLADISDKEFQNNVRQKLLSTMSNNRSRQKVISINDVKSYLNQGFEYVDSLPNRETILKMLSESRNWSHWLTPDLARWGLQSAA